jgi:hypothetical protein
VNNGPYGTFWKHETERAFRVGRQTTKKSFLFVFDPATTKQRSWRPAPPYIGNYGPGARETLTAETVSTCTVA